MKVALRVARLNVDRGTGGPFGAAIFDASGVLVAVGMNLVVSSHNSTLHAEMVAFQMAEARLGTHDLGPGRHELFTSCEPCAMCLGATLWSGVSRLVCSAAGEDALAIGFDEGPVFLDSYRYLEERGISVVRRFLQAEGKAVLDDYAARGGTIYNAVRGG
ncbi:MAG: nucleoside deaminase [Deltaproteobacteria bacterium]|nr:nucleoside deaminase [Deltaproteobacteria bacterium]